MARVSGPLMSVGASGTFAKTLTYATWKGRAYVRQRVIPANPKTALQTGIRAMFAYVAALWQSLGAPAKATWDAEATAKGISPFNAYASKNMTDWQQSLAPIQQATDARDTGAALELNCLPTGEAGYASLAIASTAGAGANAIGVIVCRSATEITEMTWDKVIAVLPFSPGTGLDFTDSPLAAGTYHYAVFGFSVDGKLGPLESDTTAVVT